MICNWRANSRPVVHGTDEGIWRRLRLVPFRVQIPTGRQDNRLAKKLAAEARGILAWLVAGARAWRELGLADPETVLQATAAYRSEQDILADFLGAECVLDDGANVPARELYERYSSWHKRTLGGEPWNQTTFGRRLTDRGLEPRKIKNLWYRLGVGPQ